MIFIVRRRAGLTRKAFIFTDTLFIKNNDWWATHADLFPGVPLYYLWYRPEGLQEAHKTWDLTGCSRGKGLRSFRRLTIFIRNLVLADKGWRGTLCPKGCYNTRSNGGINHRFTCDSVRSFVRSLCSRIITDESGELRVSNKSKCSGVNRPLNLRKHLIKLRQQRQIFPSAIF